MSETDPYAETTTGERTASTIDTPWPEQGLMEQVAISSLRARLFGSAAAVRFGRYRLEKRIGAGGMGEVYLATDSNLERRVALKRVRADSNSGALHERLQREARALARLNHPNVVQVFEVDQHEGETFLAMELVEGQTLGGWLRTPHPWREILAKFLAAGQGLAAAHSADVVHRDFKPDNVLLGDDGRIRVADFGLALRTESTPEPSTNSKARHDPRMTGTGGFVGTLRYMPLEQLQDRQVDARSDQFAFCVALYEALYGHEPFIFDNLPNRIAALERDEPIVPRADPLWKVLRRGLRRDPDARWPDMDSLLHALVRASRRPLVIAGTLAATLMVALGTWLLWPEPERCAGIERELDGIWDDSRRSAVQVAFERSGVAYATSSFTRLELGLDRWAVGWIEQRHASCAASSEADESGVEWARRTCLDRQRHAIDVLVSELSKSGEREPGAVEHVVDVLLEIPDPLDCGLDRTLEQPAIDASARERVAELRLELAELEQLRLLGRADIERTNVVVAAARALGQAPVIAEATADLGKSQIEAGSPALGLELLEQATDLALRSDHERLLAKTWLDLATRMLTTYRDVPLGQRYCELAGAQWSKLDPDPRTRSALAFCHARVSFEHGEREAARASIEAALAELGDAPDPARPAYLQMLAQLSEPEAALAWRRAAVDAAEQAWSAQHPHTANYLYELGSALLEHDAAAARPLLERAVEIWTNAHTEPHVNLAWAHLALASLALSAVAETSSEAERTRYLAEAEQHARACAEIQARTMSPDDPARGNPFNLLSHVAALRGDSQQAIARSLVALGYYERAGDTEFVQQLRYEVGTNLLAAGELERARMYFDRLRASRSESARALGELGLAELELRREDPTASLAALDRSELARLGPERVLHRTLRALAQLRVGCPSCRASAEQLVRELQADPDLGVYDLGLWLDGFALADDERSVLVPLL